MEFNTANDFKINMMFGAASAATQVDGGELNHSWNYWYKAGHIKDGSNPARANDHYNRYEEDIALMKELGLKTYRLGVEWARLEPEEGKFSDEAAAHYRGVIEKLIETNIVPLLTLHHFTNPMWFENKGGFLKEENCAIFLRFVEFCIKSFGPLVSDYITINEPNVFAMLGYFAGEWPPGERSFNDYANVLSNMAQCHIQAYKLIHKMRTELGFNDTKVSFAHHMRVFEPKSSSNIMHKALSAFSKRGFQSALESAFYRGEVRFPLRKRQAIMPGCYCDYIALNYYTRTTVDKLGDGVREGAPKNDLGWEIYPDGIAICALELYTKFKLPIYITENGTCDNNDTFRARYIYEHIKALNESGLPVERYYHWCFLDNFEWLEGESSRFGLVHVDYETQRREIKQSGRFYADIIKNSGVTGEAYEKYVKDQSYKY